MIVSCSGDLLHGGQVDKQRVLVPFCSLVTLQHSPCVGTAALKFPKSETRVSSISGIPFPFLHTPSLTKPRGAILFLPPLPDPGDATALIFLNPVFLSNIEASSCAPVPVPSSQPPECHMSTSSCLCFLTTRWCNSLTPEKIRAC